METSNQTDGQSTEGNANSENQTTEPVKNPEGVLNKNRELLGVNKKLSSKVSELEEMVKTFNQDQQISEGRKDEVIGKLREEVKVLRTELVDTKDSYNWNTVESQVKQAALKDGCVDPDKLVKLIDDNDFAALEVDGKFRVNQEDLTSLLTKVKKGNPFMFSEGSANIDDLNPSNKIQKVTKKPISEMSTAEIEAALKELP
jgi:hypothetical protein